MISINKWAIGEKLSIRASISIKDSGYVWRRGVARGTEIRSFALLHFSTALNPELCFLVGGLVGCVDKGIFLENIVKSQCTVCDTYFIINKNSTVF